MLCVRRVTARAWLDDSGEALARAERQAADGDESWARWVAEYRTEMALVLRVEVTLELLDRSPFTVQTVQSGLWVEKRAHPAQVEQQIAEALSTTYADLITSLAAEGHHLDLWELAEMYAHVELSDDVRAALQPECGPDA